MYCNFSLTTINANGKILISTGAMTYKKHTIKKQNKIFKIYINTLMHRIWLDYKESWFNQESRTVNVAQADLRITNDVIHLKLTGKAFHICVALHWNVLLFVFSGAFGTLGSPLKLALVLKLFYLVTLVKLFQLYFGEYFIIFIFFINIWFAIRRLNKYILYAKGFLKACRPPKV